MSDARYIIVDKTCPVCGKNFIPAPEHAYKIRVGKGRSSLVCTYSCMLKWRKKHEKVPTRREYTKGGS